MQTNTHPDTEATAYNIHGLAIALNLILVEIIDQSPDKLEIQAIVNSLKAQAGELVSQLNQVPTVSLVKAA
jgi:hypothetical protein